MCHKLAYTPAAAGYGYDSPTHFRHVPVGDAMTKKMPIELMSTPFAVQPMPNYVPSMGMGGVTGIVECISGYLQHANQCQVEIERIQAQRAVALKSIEAQAQQHLKAMHTQLVQALHSNQNEHTQRMTVFSILQQDIAGVQQLRQQQSQDLQQIMQQILNSGCPQERAQLIQIYQLRLSSNNFVEEISHKMQMLISVLHSKTAQRLT